LVYYGGISLVDQSNHQARNQINLQTNTMNRYELEQQLWDEGYKRVMGLDEVGRGCLCGPVVAAGVIIEPGTRMNPAIADSKSLSEPIRRELAEEIKESVLLWTVEELGPRKIDELNILKASIRAMLNCSERPGAKPDYLLVDGNRFTSSLVPYSCVVKGDDRSASIAAASILAKVHRDNYMKNLHDEYPFYGWDSNVGYPTQTHYRGLEEYGYTIHHRRSFRLKTDKEYKG
jgi:ribonuclease HII